VAIDPIDARGYVVVDVFNNRREGAVATVNFSVPDDVKESFNATFAGQNKSRIIADLMRRAVAEEERQQRRAAALDRLAARRSRRPSASDDDVRAIREQERP